MGADLGGEEISSLLNQREGTVARYLSTPSQIPILERVAIATSLILAGCFVSSVVFRLLMEGGRLPLSRFPFLAGVIESLIFPLAVILTASVVTTIAVHILFRGRVDECEVVKKVAIGVMVRQDRSGVSMATMMKDIGISARHVAGGAVVCQCLRFRFDDRDFIGVSSGDFGAFYHEVFDGRLFVYFTKDAAEKVRERRYSKAGGRNASNR